MNSKKEWERKIIDDIKKILDDFPNGDLQDFEGPDFVINIGDEIIGIEITEYIRGQTPNGSQKRHEEIVHERMAILAKKRFETKREIPLWVEIQPSPHNKLSDIPTIEREKIVNLIVEKVEQNIPDEVYDDTLVNIDWKHDKQLYKCVSHISIVRCKRDSLWSFASADWVEASKDEIQKIIDMKNALFQSYMEFCHRAWLIIVARGYPMSSIVDISRIINHEFNSEFKRILFYFSKSKEVIEIKIF